MKYTSMAISIEGINSPEQTWLLLLFPVTCFWLKTICILIWISQKPVHKSPIDNKSALQKPVHKSPIDNKSALIWAMAYRQVSNIRRTLIGNKIVDNSEVVGASPVGAAPTTSSLST